MTLQQAHERYPLVPQHIIAWAIENISDPEDLVRGLNQLQQAIAAAPSRLAPAPTHLHGAHGRPQSRSALAHVRTTA